ncbi:hypothetical protein ACIBFB_22180 [Nocardiopsis sp. NPDC050513]|uniref:hypothetical protein n=1 Tax=Nocardiopsis sp. NPDC050513 TaxID=3364338 RepID=UPI0037ACB3EB
MRCDRSVAVRLSRHRRRLGRQAEGAPEVPPEVLDHAREAFTAGMNVAAVTAMALRHVGAAAGAAPGTVGGTPDRPGVRGG